MIRRRNLLDSLRREAKESGGCCELISDMADGTRRETQQASHAVLRGTTSTAGGSEEEARCVRFLTRITPAMMSLSILASDTYRSPRRRTAFERTTAVIMALRLFGTRDLLHDICGRDNLGWHGNSWRHIIGDRHASTGQETAGHTNADAAGMAAADPANSEAWTRNSDVGVRRGWFKRH